MSFFTELQRRNVVRVGVAYTVVSWVVAQVAEFAFESFGAPEWAIKSLVVLLLIGLVPVLVFAWIYEMTPEGLKKEKDVDRTTSITPQTGRRIDRVIIGTLAVAVAFFAADKYLWHSHTGDVIDAAPVAETVETVQADDGPPEKSVAVLPFIAMSDGPDDEFFADGLTVEILNSLAQLPELLVTARTSAFVFKGDNLPSVPDIARQLGVRHVVEGSVRRSGDRLRVTAQLIRASDGFHLWSKNYDSTSADAIQVQENIAERIAVALDVVLDEEKSAAMRKAGLRDVEAFTAYQKGIKLFNEAHGQLDIVSGLRAANEYFDKVIERVPNYPDVYTRHADLYTHMLNDHVWGVRGNLYTEEEAAAAYPAAIADLQAALRHTDNRDELLQRELDLAFVQGNWRGLVARTRRALESDVCDESNWMSSIANVVGLSEAHIEQSKRIVACDPLRSISWFNLARALLWAGRHEEAVEAAREGLERARLKQQELELGARNIQQQVEELGGDVTELAGTLPEAVEVETWQQELDRLQEKITRLEPVNLAAIQEYEEESKRKDYLDSQNDDLCEALTTLENAIAKIDRKTRTRFKETFERVNKGVQELFPRLFGGGHGYLELTGEDLLTTGVSIMAQPPGKRISNLQLLSGGEKALTAVAFVFSIFRLNPAPFCLLDEVDAPLDDANVIRFSNMVKEMSDTVQFIFVTHNKITMEMAYQMSGVTMREPGVSRLVQVDIDEAAALAAE